MNLTEAKAILKENDYVVEENKRETWRDYLDVYEDTHPKATFFAINDMIKDLATECDPDWRDHYSEPEYAIDLSFDDIVKLWGEPENLD